MEDEVIGHKRDTRRVGAARQQVLDALADRDGPVSVEELAAELPSIHLASIYRNLTALEEAGIVRHVHLAHGPARYELSETASVTQHLICEVCGRNIVVPSSVLDDLRAVLEREHHFVLVGQHFALPGHCSSCADDLTARPQAHSQGGRH